MNCLFVDTAGWMAMADRKDPLNAAAIAARDQWLENEGVLATSNYIVDETLTLIRMRIGLDAAKKWWAMVSKSPRCKMYWITPEREETAIQWFFDWQDQSFSFTDCTSFVLMKELGVTKALTADKHFITAGFEMLPTDQ
ncbi:MAG: PIN domain-containing protein [Desulfobacterales bacterium]|nr:PIN domain-containing protein [Desulfobacterales bacterium]